MTFLKVWDGLSGEEELSLQHKHIVKSVFFSNDSAALATARYDFSVLPTPPLPTPCHCFGSGSELDPYSIRSMDPDPDPGGQKLPTKIEIS